MNIADLIAALSAGQDPNQAVIKASMPAAIDPSPAKTAAATPGIRPEYMETRFFPPLPGSNPGEGENARAQGGPPQGIPTPVTNPQPASESPKVTQSPPDLANMYVQLMQKNQNAQAMDRSLALIAAGITPYAANRASLIGLAGQDSGRKTMTAADLLAFNKVQQEQKDRLLRQSMLKGIAKQYGLTDEAVTYLEASGKLDEVIKHHNTQNLTVVEDSATKQKAFYDHRGNFIANIGGPEPEKKSWQGGPQGQQLVSDVTGQPVGQGLGLPPKFEYKEDKANGGYKVIDGNTGQEVGLIPGGLPPKFEYKENKAEGGYDVIDGNTGKPVGKIPGGLQPLEEERKLAIINKDRSENGQKPLTMEEYLKKYGKGGVTVNVGPQGQQFNKPPEGQDYYRNEDGTVKVFEDGKPKLYSLEGGPAGGKIAETEADVRLKEEKVRKAAEAKIEEKRGRYAAASSAYNAIEGIEDDLMTNILPAVGFGSSIPAQFGSTAATHVRAKIKTLDAINALEQLRALRASSETGAGLGPVSDFENKMLASTIASLDPNQDEKTILKNVSRIKAAMRMLAEKSFDPKRPEFAGKDEAGMFKEFNDTIQKYEVEVENDRLKKYSKGKSKAERIN